MRYALALLAALLLPLAARAQGALTIEDKEALMDSLGAQPVRYRVTQNGDVFAERGSEVLARVRIGDSLEVRGIVNPYAYVTLPDGRAGKIGIEYLRFTRGDIQALMAAGEAFTTTVERREMERERVEAAYREAGAAVQIEDLFAISTARSGNARVALFYRYLHPTQQLKYLRVTVQPYNRVGDRLTDDVSRRGEFVLNVTGPLSADVVGEVAEWNDVWFNSATSCARITRVEVTYMDDSREVFVRDLPDVFGPGYVNGCSVDEQAARMERMMLRGGR